MLYRAQYKAESYVGVSIYYIKILVWLPVNVSISHNKNKWYV